MSKGYLSEKSKKKFTIITGILGAVFLIMQFVVPFLIMIPFMIFGIAGMEDSPEYKLNYAVPYETGILAKEKISSGKNRKYKTVKITPEKITPLFDCNSYPWLARNENQTWCFTEKILRKFENNKWTILTNNINWGKIISVKAIDNGVVVETEYPDGTNVFYTFCNNIWSASPTFFQSEYPYDKNIFFDGVNYTFREKENELYCKKGADGKWIKIIHVYNSNWYPLVFKNKLMVINLACEPAEIVELTESGWVKKEYKKLPKYFSSCYVAASSNKVNIVVSKSLGDLFWYSFDGEKIQKQTIKKSFFPFFMMPLMFLPYIMNIFMPLLMAFVITILIRKYRNPEYKIEEKNALYAPLIRRAFAEIIDVLIVAIPIIVVMISGIINISIFDAMEENTAYIPFAIIGFLFFSCGYGIAMLLVYSFLEGKYCATPGKWLLKIRVVGTDLKPCGFGRAFLRNILRFVDGFLNYLVGILIIAFTENQQRIGDMAASTIVIKKHDRQKSENIV